MSDFRNRLLGFAAIASAFAGLSYGQTFQCGYNGVIGTTGTGLGYVTNGQGYAPTQVRVSATNDLVTDLTFACANNGVSSTGALTVTLSAPVVTSPPNDPTLIITQVTGATGVLPTPPFTYALPGPPPGTFAGSTTSYAGTVVGNTVTFTAVTFPATAYVVEIANIRVNATSLSPGTNITELASITNLGLVEFSATNLDIVAETFADFSVDTVGIGGPYAICQSGSATFTFGVTEKFGAAFKAAIPGGITNTNAAAGLFCNGVRCDMANGQAGSWSGTAFTSLLNAGAYVTPGIGSGLGKATHGTRFAVTFGNVTSGITITLPTTITQGTGPNYTFVAYMTANPTGAFSFVPGTANQFTVPQNGTVYYEVAFADDSIQNIDFSVTGTYSWGANFSNNAVTAPTVSIVLDPAAAVNPATNDIPNFVTTPNSQNLSTWILCNTTLLFPYLANGGGFDTGIVFANTSTDPLTTIGAGTAAHEQGTCSLWFYGTGAPTNPVSAPGGVQATGTVNAFTLSSVAPGFSGYAIAICNYQYAHGFAYITYDLTANNGAAMGYLALVIGGNHHRPIGGSESAEYLNN
jgi:hypothetical protein